MSDYRDSRPTRRNPDLTFKYDLRRGRHGWLRLTPAYSIKLVGDILATSDQEYEFSIPSLGPGPRHFARLMPATPAPVWRSSRSLRGWQMPNLRHTRQSAFVAPARNLPR